MQDRLSQFPGRVELIPVPGLPNHFDMVLRDQPIVEGTPPIKENLLRDETAALFGFEPGEFAKTTVNDVLERVPVIIEEMEPDIEIDVDGGVVGRHAGTVSESIHIDIPIAALGAGWSRSGNAYTKAAGTTEPIAFLMPENPAAYLIAFTITGGSAFDTIGFAAANLPTTANIGGVRYSESRTVLRITTAVNNYINITPSNTFAGTVTITSINLRTIHQANMIGVNNIRYIHHLSSFGAGQNVLGYNSGNSNVAIGFAALYMNTTGGGNTAIGSQALSKNVTGMNNVAVGEGALITSEGSNNVAVGYYALANTNTGGSASTAVGYQALSSNTTGRGTAVGMNALGTNTTGLDNVAVGGSALSSNTTGGGNTAIGSQALSKNVTGMNNVAVGKDALYYGTGSGNTVIGSIALSENPLTGSNNTVIGFLAGSALQGNITNVNLFGYQATSTGNNQVVLGNNQITQIRAQVTTITSMSDERVKEYHTPADIDRCLEAVMGIPVSRYKYKDFTGAHLDGNVVGWMADDVEKVFPKSVTAHDTYFPVLDENGDEIMEEVEVEVPGFETVEENGETMQRETMRKETRQERKMFKMEQVKEVTPTEMLPTLWGAVQALAKRVDELEARLAATATA